METLSSCGSQRRRSESNRRMEVLQFSESLCTGLRFYRSCVEVTSYNIARLPTVPDFSVLSCGNFPRSSHDGFRGMLYLTRKSCILVSKKGNVMRRF
jgi:hypothetical protein